MIAFVYGCQITGRTEGIRQDRLSQRARPEDWRSVPEGVQRQRLQSVVQGLKETSTIFPFTDFY